MCTLQFYLLLSAVVLGVHAEGDGLTRIPQERTVVGSCTVDIGRCPLGSCMANKNFRGYICPNYQEEKIECYGFGVFQVDIVKSCGCCFDHGITVEGLVVDATDDKPLSAMVVSKNGIGIGVSDCAGTFRTTVFRGARKVVFKASDRSRRYLDAIKVVDIPKYFRGPISVKLPMLRRGPSFQFDSSIQTVLSISNTPTDSDAGNATLTIPPNSFYRGSTLYSGEVIGTLTFVKVSDRNVEDQIPGRLETSAGEQLYSDGMFVTTFEDTAGVPLKTRFVRVTVRKGMKLWSLSEQGQWSLLPLKQVGIQPSKPLLARRFKRQSALTETFLAKVENFKWVNIDKIPGAPVCYFKARVFEKLTGTEILSSATASFRTDILAFTQQSERLRLSAPFTDSPSTTCFAARCPSVSDLLVGFISMTSVEMISVGGYAIPHTETLEPKKVVDYSLPIQSSHLPVQYEVTPNNEEIYVNFLSNLAGPFYTNEATCLSSNDAQPAFHFWKSPLPSIVPFDSTTELCTARIGVFGSTSFYQFLSGLATPVSVAGISTWNGPALQYFTDLSILKSSTIGGVHYFACLQYRCSEDNALTKLYVDIDVPVNASGKPEFACRHKCDSSDECGMFGIEGITTPPVLVGDGPDFFNSTSSSCDGRSKTEEFALDIYCYKRQ